MTSFGLSIGERCQDTPDAAKFATVTSSGIADLQIGSGAQDRQSALDLSRNHHRSTMFNLNLESRNAHGFHQARCHNCVVAHQMIGSREPNACLRRRSSYPVRSKPRTWAVARQLPIPAIGLRLTPAYDNRPALIWPVRRRSQDSCIELLLYVDYRQDADAWLPIISIRVEMPCCSHALPRHEADLGKQSRIGICRSGTIRVR